MTLQELVPKTDLPLQQHTALTLFNGIKYLFLKNSEAPRPKGGASQKGNYLFQIASLNPALKSGLAGKRNGQF
jgi:hypothetical protein